jgi:hypothetical protein
MQHRAVFGDVDLLAGEHPVAPAFDIGGLREVEQQPQRLAVDALLGGVDQQIVEPIAVAGETIGLGAEEVAQMPAARGFRMRLQRLPGRQIGQRAHRVAPQVPVT